MEDSPPPQTALHSEMPASTEISSTATHTPALGSRNETLICKMMDNEGHPSGSLASSQSDENEIHAFPFLKLPAEIRVRVYRYLLHSWWGIHIYSTKPDSAVSEGIVRRRFPYRDCHPSSAYLAKLVTYEVNAPGVHPAILSVNRRTYLEASKLFYSENLFTFLRGTIIPFLEDRSEGSRRLIKQIEFCTYVFTFIPGNLHFRHVDHIFEESCNYLSQSLQLENVTLRCFEPSSGRIRNSPRYKDYLSNIDKQNWVQQLVPLVKNLISLWVVECTADETDLALAAQTYLRSMMDGASKKVRQTQNVQELAHDPTAPGVQHGLGA